jgi:ribosome-associated protein
VAVLDMRKVSSVTDYYVIVSGTSLPHLKAMANEVQHALKQAGVYCYRRGGEADGGWVVVDYIDVVVHVFLTEVRAYYALEELWADAPRVKPRSP